MAAGDYTVDTGDQPPLPACVRSAPRQPFPADNFVCSEPSQELIDQANFCRSTASRTLALGRTVNTTITVGNSVPYPISEGQNFTASFSVSHAVAQSEAASLTLPACAHTQWVAIANGCKWVSCAEDGVDRLFAFPDGRPGNVECSDNATFAACPSAPILNNQCRFSTSGRKPYAVVPMSCQFGEYGAVDGVAAQEAQQKFKWWNHNVGCPCETPVPGCPNQCQGGECPNPVARMYCSGPQDPVIRTEWLSSPLGDRDKALVEWTDNLGSSQLTQERVEIKYWDSNNPGDSRTRRGVDSLSATCPGETVNAFQQRQRLDRYRSWDLAIRYRCPAPGAGMSEPVYAHIQALPRPQVKCRSCPRHSPGAAALGEGESGCSCVLAAAGEQGAETCDAAPLCPADCNYDGICQGEEGEVAGRCDDCQFASAYECRCEWSGSCQTLGPTCRELEEGQSDFAAAASCVQADFLARLPFCCGDGFCAPEGGESPENCRRDCGGPVEIPPDPGCQTNWDCWPDQVCCATSPDWDPFPTPGECVDLFQTERCVFEQVQAGPYCGDGSCDEMEGPDSCAEDCGETSGFACGNGVCNWQDGEDDLTCPRDCTVPGGTCVPACAGASCFTDDGCGGVCGLGSGCAICPDSCWGVTCGAQACGRTCEEGSGCFPAYCSSRFCGDGLCDGTCFENEVNCQADCRACTPATCGSLGLYCGSANDGCGGSLSCGSCGVNQECAAGSCRTCSTQLSPGLLNVPSAGVGGAQAGVSSQCDWTLGTAPSWVTLGERQGGANGFFRFDVAANVQQAARSATIAAGNQAFRIEQAACSAQSTLQTYSLTIGRQGGIGQRVKVYLSGPCAWTAISNVPWLTVTGGGSGVGNGEVFFTVASTSVARTGTLTIAGKTFTVTQTK